MTMFKKLLVGGALFLALILGALFGVAAPGQPGHLGGVPVAHADGCDSFPPPGLDCGPTPTPTPLGH